MERELAADPRIRRVCAEQQLAIVFLKCGLNAADIPGTLDRLAEASGYRELSVAPLFFVGHSAGGPQARRAARQFGSRCFGLLQYRGADPGDVDHNGAHAIAPGIPALMMVGQFDEFGKIGRDADDVENWEKDRDKLAAFRSRNAGHLASLAVEPGAGHFAWSERNAEYVAMFLRKAAQVRIPSAIDVAEPVKLKTIDPAGGWLTDLALRSRARQAPEALAQFAGDRSFAAWHFDQEMADATVAYHRGLERRDQFIRWHDLHTVNAGARNFFSNVDWVADGQTFAVHPAYAVAFPRQMNGQGPRWGDAGKPAARSAVPIHVKPVSGPLVLGEARHTFRIRYDELAPATEDARLTFMAFSHGDDEFRYTECVGMISSSVLEAGESQTISFPAIGNLTAANPALELKASSSSGLPVEFHVAYGPARISEGRLQAAEIPGRAKRPLAVKVVAYQFGRAIEPRVRSAPPVEQTILVEPR